MFYPDTSKITGEDFNEYLKIYGALGDKPGYSSPIKNIVNARENKGALELLFKDFNKKSKISKTNKTT